MRLRRNAVPGVVVRGDKLELGLDLGGDLEPVDERSDYLAVDLLASPGERLIKIILDRQDSAELLGR